MIFIDVTFIDGVLDFRNQSPNVLRPMFGAIRGAQSEQIIDACRFHNSIS